MAIYSTFFVCEDRLLTTIFPRWKPPLSLPRTRTVLNPFTKATHTISTFAPEWDDDEPMAPEPKNIVVTSISEDYRDYLEARLPDFVKSRPHRCLKGLTRVELEPLVEAVAEREDSVLDDALYAPPSECRELLLFRRPLRAGWSIPTVKQFEELRRIGRRS